MARTADQMATKSGNYVLRSRQSASLVETLGAALVGRLQADAVGSFGITDSRGRQLNSCHWQAVKLECRGLIHTPRWQRDRMVRAVEITEEGLWVLLGACRALGKNLDPAGIVAAIAARDEARRRSARYL